MTTEEKTSMLEALKGLDLANLDHTDKIRKVKSYFGLNMKGAISLLTDLSIQEYANYSNKVAALMVEKLNYTAEEAAEKIDTGTYQAMKIYFFYENGYVAEYAYNHLLKFDLI